MICALSHRYLTNTITTVLEMYPELDELGVGVGEAVELLEYLDRSGAYKLSVFSF